MGAEAGGGVWRGKGRAVMGAEGDAGVVAILTLLFGAVQARGV